MYKMKRLGVNGAVRPLYGSLGVKRLSKKTVRHLLLHCTVQLVEKVLFYFFFNLFLLFFFFNFVLCKDTARGCDYIASVLDEQTDRR